MVRTNLSEQAKRSLEETIVELRGKSITIVIDYIDPIDKEVEMSISINDEKGEGIVSIGPGLARVGDTITLMNIDQAFDIKFT